MKKIVFFSVLVTLFGCTPSMWQASPTYQETVTGIFVAKDDNTLFVSGREYAYRFDIDSEFKELLVTHDESNLFVHKMDFSVDEQNKISGEVDLVILESSVSSSVKQVYSVELSGERYQIQGNFAYIELDRPLILKIERPNKSFDTVKKIVATPATVAYDAVTVPIVAVVFAVLPLLP